MYAQFSRPRVILSINDSQASSGHQNKRSICIGWFTYSPVELGSDPDEIDHRLKVQKEFRTISWLTDPYKVPRNRIRKPAANLDIWSFCVLSDEIIRKASTLCLQLRVKFSVKFMGGKEQIDSNIDCYQRGEKWCFYYLFNLSCIVCSTLLSTALSHRVQSFRLTKVLSLRATYLLLKYGADKTAPAPARRFISTRIIRDDAVRLENSDHITLMQQSWRRCAVCRNKKVLQKDSCCSSS